MLNYGHLEIEVFFRIKVLIREILCHYCSPLLGGVMLVRKKKVRLLAVNIERRGRAGDFDILMESQNKLPKLEKLRRVP